MADYLKIFSNKAEYDEYIESGYPKPNVSYIEDTDETIFTNYKDGEAGPERVLLGMKTEDFTGTEFNKGYNYITEAYIPDGVTTIGYQAFYTFGRLASVTIPDSVTTIGGSAFYYCTKLTSVVIPNSVTSIGSSAFEGCIGMTSVNIPDNVTTIEQNAFSRCSGLTSVTIGNSITSIGGAVFQNCNALTSVTVRATTPPTLGGGVFNSTSSRLVIYVPAESVEAYKAAASWSSYARKIQAIPA